MHILIADDDPVCRDFLEGLVTTWGFSVSLAADGEQAMRLAQGLPRPDVIILDWMMPKLDGFEVCRKLKQSADQDQYIIMITGGSRKDDLIKPLVAGADDYIVKPFDGIDVQLHLRNAATTLGLREENRELRDRLFAMSQSTT
jgi:DNA-binding response OmpR family regulator